MWNKKKHLDINRYLCCTMVNCTMNHVCDYERYGVFFSGWSLHNTGVCVRVGISNDDYPDAEPPTMTNHVHTRAHYIRWVIYSVDKLLPVVVISHRSNGRWFTNSAVDTQECSETITRQHDTLDAKISRERLYFAKSGKTMEVWGFHPLVSRATAIYT